MPGERIKRDGLPNSVARALIHVDYAIELIDKGQLPAPPEAADVERWPWPLKIFTLGQFTNPGSRRNAALRRKGAAWSAEPAEDPDRAGRSDGIRCHTRRGQASRAVTIYGECQRVLTKRLGVMPSEKTTSLYLAAIEGRTAGPGN